MEGEGDGGGGGGGEGNCQMQPALTEKLRVYRIVVV